MSITLNEILKELPKMNPSERALLKAALEELSTGQADNKEPLLYVVVKHCLNSKIPWTAFVTSRPAVVFKRHAQAIDAFLDQHFAGASKIERQALMTFIIRALIASLKGRGVPISMGTLVTNLGRYQDIFEDEFPGYISGGLAPMIMAMLKPRE